MGARDEIVRFLYEVTGDKDVAATAATMLKAGEAAGTTQEEFDALSKSLNDAASKFKLINQAIGQKAALADLTSQLSGAQAGLDKLRSEFDSTDASSKKVTKAFTDAEKAVASLTQQQTAASVALQKTQGALAKSGVDTTNLAASLQKVNAQGNAAATQLAEIGQASAKAAAGTADAAKSTKSLGEESSKSSGLLEELKSHLLAIVSTATLLEVALKGIEFGKESVAGAADVEQTLSRIKATAQGAAEQFGQLDEAITQAARAANVTNQVAASAALALAQQGQSAAEIFKTLTPTLLLTRDANIEVGESAKIVNEIIRLFGQNASDAAGDVDKLVVASGGSGEKLQAMATALQQLAPDAKQLGLSFDQLVGTLGFLQQNGIDASKSIRGLRTVFQDLENPASAFVQALARAGDTSQDFGKAIATIRDGGEKGQQALLTLSGAARSLAAFLAQQAPDAVDKFIASLGNAGGAAQRLQKMIDDNLKGSFNGFENAILNLGEKLATPILKPLADEFVKLSAQINQFVDSDAFASIATQVGKLATDIVRAFDGIISGINWDDFVGQVKVAVSGAGDDLHKLADNASMVAASINKIAAALGAVAQFGSVGFKAIEAAFGATATATVGAADLVVKGVDKVRGSTSDLGKALDDATAKGAAFTKETLVGGSEAAQGLATDLSDLGDSASTAFTNFKAGADSTAPSIKQIGDSATEAADATQKFGDVGPGVFENTAAAANKAAKAVSDHNQAILDAEAAVDKAHHAFQDLVQSGNASAEAMLQAKNAYDVAAEALDKLKGKTDDTTDAQNKLKIAFAGLHITSQKQLEDDANAAKANLDLINEAFQNNQAKIEDVRRAYVAYGQAEHTAFSASADDVKQQVDENLKLLASSLGIPEAFKDSADKAEDFGKRGKKAIDDVTDSATKAGKAIKDAGSETQQWAQKIDDFNTSSQAWGDQLAAAATKAASAQEGIAIQTNEQLRLLREARDEWLSGAISGEEYARRISVALGGVDTELQKQTQALQKFNDELNSLQSDLASANGDNVTVENLRHQKKIDDIKAETDLSISQRQKLEQLEEQIHEANLKRIKDENAARANTGNNAQGGGAGTSPTPNAPAPAPTQQVAQPSVSSVFNIVLLSGDKNAVDQLGDLVARRVDQRIKEIARRSV
jgi:TP901 family phage tail tape measure protein